MPDTKISALTNGNAVQATDDIPAVRAGNNVRVQVDLSDKVVGVASSIDSEIALFSGTGGKTIKRATTTGVLRADSGVISAATADTHYATPTVSKFLAEGTWANLPAAASYSGRIYPCTDIGNVGLSFWISNGSTWRLMAPTDFYIVTNGSAGTTSASEQILTQWTSVPAGVLTKLRYFSIKAVFAKDGTTDAATAMRFRMGTAGTTSDAQLFNSGSFSAANRSFSVESLWFASSATQVRAFGNQAAQIAWQGTGGTSIAYPQNVTVSDMDANVLQISASVQMAGTTNTPQVPHLIVTGY